MKTSLSLGLVVFYIFFAVGSAYCEESFYIGVPYNDTKSKVSFPVSSSNKTKETQKVENNEKQNGLSKIFKSNKPKKQKRYNSLTNKTETVPQGYYGSLPNIEQDFQYKKAKPPQTSSDVDAYIPQEMPNDNEFKEAPTKDSLFLDVIVKKEKASNYLNDIQKTKFALNNLKKCIEENGDIQRFNGCVNVIDLYCQNLKTKYQNKSDSLKESYMDILNTNYYAKVLGNLLYDANYYAQYTPTNTGKYSKENIENQKQDLLKRINKTLFLIANET